jgi:hypothetical protein
MYVYFIMMDFVNLKLCLLVISLEIILFRFEFAIELGKIINVYKNYEEIKRDYNWLKNIKDRR